MIDIYICEDIQKQRERIAYYVETAIMIEEYDMELKLATDDAGAFLQAVKKLKNTGLYFLDIDLEAGKTGWSWRGRSGSMIRGALSFL